MKRCKTCKRKFPKHLIQTMITLQGAMTQCPLCQLEMRNLIHGMPADTPFQGEIAASMWQEAHDHIATTTGRKP